MKFPKKTIFTSRHVWHMFTLTLLVAIMAVSATAQRSVFGSKTLSETTKELAPAAPPNLDQCSNGANGSPLQQCTGANWQNGNLNENNSQWVEGQAVPYRVTFTDLVAGSTGNTITIEYDTTEQGKHAIDYLMSYNYTATNADPCSGVTGCSASSMQFPIPLDPNVAAGGVTQIGGQFFTMFGGGTITSVSAYQLIGTYAGSSQTRITITFNAGTTPDSVVLAWGGHISTRFDWGFAFSAVNLPGSPYHMRIIGTGNQDRSMSVAGIIFPGRVTVRKQVNYILNGVPQTTSTLPFGFSSTNFAAAFALTDNRSGNAPSPGDPQEPTYTDTNVVSYTTFGQTITVTETAPPAPWTLSDLTCTSNNGGNTTSPTVSTNLGTRTATIVLTEANIVSCVFTNTATIITAAPASISGRVSAADGTGIYGARMVLTNASTGETFYALTNPFGYYTFEGMPVSDFYIIGVSHKRHAFAEDQRTFTLNEDLTGVDFIAN